MADWINCIKCGYKFGAFMSTCPNPRCKSPNQVNKKLPLNKSSSKKFFRKGRIIVSCIIIGIVLCSSISIFILPSVLPPTPTITDLKAYALKKINEDRAKFGLSPVTIDNDNPAAQFHANELLKTQSLSHWTTDGMKPYMRYSIYGGHDNVVQNVAEEKYGLVSLSIWNYGNSNQQSSSDAFDQIRLEMCKAGIALCDNLINPYKAIDNLEYNMIYNDLDCCSNGHRMNILDKYHTHISIGIAYDKFYIALVQNFEDKYTIWKNPITYNSKYNTVSMSGRLKDNVNSFDGITVSYDPLPSQERYKQNLNSESYSEGQTVARILPHWFAPLISNSHNGSDNEQLIVANKSMVSNVRNTGGNIGTNFDISFPITVLTKKYGPGVYTVDTWYNDTNNNPFQASSVSLFVH